MATSRSRLLPSLEATAALAGRVAGLARAGDAILLQGPLGAGKSAFARAFLRHAAGDAGLEVPSPTFTLVQSYDTAAFQVHHFDLWRLDGPDALTELGWEDALRDVVLVEWPERLGAFLPEHALTVALAMAGDAARHATLTGWPDRLPALLEEALA
jgi:tRNA threonylcarbamoyladenosine biosynthesis protein TsaE